MKKFVALYYNTSGAHQAPPTMTEEEKAAMMAPWEAWQAKYGARVVNMGAPFLPASASSDGDTWSASKNLVTGFSIVAADDLEAAQEMFAGHPMYNYPDHAVEISECAPM